jgi:hypothetical protein
VEHQAIRPLAAGHHHHDLSTDTLFDRTGMLARNYRDNLGTCRVSQNRFPFVKSGIAKELRPWLGEHAEPHVPDSFLFRAE